MLPLFFKILDMSVTAGAVILIVLVLRLFLRKAPKVYSYALWSVVLFRLLCPVSIESGLSIIPNGMGYTPSENTMEIYEAMEPGETTMAAYHAVGDVLNGGLGTITVRLEPEYAQSADGSGAYGALLHPDVWFLIFARLWPAGAAFMAAYSLCSLWELRRKLKKAVWITDNIWRVDRLNTAFVLGVFWPKIYLPDGLSAAEMSYIVRHEQYHIHRGDHIVKLLAFAALCIHWFNPLVWLAFVLAGKDMEMSCDEAVLKQMGDDIRADYSQSLLSLAAGRRFVAATPLAFGEGDTKGRIQNVLKWKKPGVKVTVIAALVCVIAAVLCISDPARPVDTEQVTEVRRLVSREATESVAAPFEFEAAWVYEGLPVGETEMESLLTLLDGHTATRRMSLPDWEPRNDESGARLEMADGSYFELRRWYVNGFSFHPAHYGEDEYDTTLAKYDADGNMTACWTMDYDFDRPFGDWLSALAREEKEQNAAANRMSISFINLPAGQTCYLNEDVVLAEKGSSVEYHITYDRAGLTLQVGLRGEDGTEYIHNVEGGSRVGAYNGLAAGRYTPFVRNVDMGYEYEAQATGVIHFDLTSDRDYFQKSTPWEPEAGTIQDLPEQLSREQVLHHAILAHHRSAYSDQYFCCANYIVLANEEGTRYNPVTGDDLKTMTYYLWVLYQEYLFTEDGIVDEGGAHIPTAVTLTENADGSWSELNYWEPRDGSYYVEDIRATFPGEAAEEALHSQKYIMAQVQDCYAQAVEYARIDSDAQLDVDAVIKGLLDEICSEPLHASDVYSYLEAHPIEYRELLYYGEYTRDYCLRQLQNENGEENAPGKMGLNRAIREVLLKELGG